MRRGDIANTSHKRVDHSLYRKGMLSDGPDLFQPVFVEKQAGEVGLWVQVGRHHVDLHLREHPSEVINQRSFPNPTLVVEERYGDHEAGRIVTRT